MKPDMCIYHGNCADGFGAAWAVWKRFGDDVEFVPGFYGNPPPTVADKNVVMVDFSYKAPVLESLLRSGDANQAMTILILDHHKTAAEDLAGLDAPEGDYDPYLWRKKWESWMTWPVRSVFDMDRSGAQIAWDFFHPGEPRPVLIDYIGDRDLWRFNLPLSREIAAYVFSFPYDFKQWSNMVAMAEDHMLLQGMADQGGAIERKHHKDIAELVKVTKRTMIIGGYAVPVASLPYTMSSDAGNLMAKGERFAACYWDTPTKRVFSLRSTADGLDVSAVAVRYGGGGHKNAAGFQMPIGWEGDPSPRQKAGGE